MGWGDALTGVGRVCTVCSGGVVGFLAFGPVGAVLTGIAVGAEFDMIHSAVALRVNGCTSLKGYVKDVDGILHNPKDPGNYGNLGIRIAVDGAVGLGAGKVANGELVPGLLTPTNAASVCLKNNAESKTGESNS